MTTEQNDFNKKRSGGQTGFWGKPLANTSADVDASANTDTNEDVVLEAKPVREVPPRKPRRRSIPKIGPSEVMEALPRVESFPDQTAEKANDKTEEEVPQGDGAESLQHDAVFTPVPEIVDAFEQDARGGSVPSWLSSEPEEDVEDVEYEEAFVYEYDDEHIDTSPEYEQVLGGEFDGGYEDEYEVVYEDEPEVQAADVEDVETVSVNVYEGVSEFGDELDDGFDDEFDDGFDDFDLEEPEDESDSTMSLPRLEDEGRESKASVTGVHHMLSWDDEPEEEKPKGRKAGFHLFGPGNTTNYVSGETVYDEADEPGFDEKGRRIRLGAVAVSIAAACALTYGLGVQRFSNRALPRTYVGVTDVSGLELAQVQKALEEETANYVCNVKAGKFSANISSANAGLTRDEEKIAKAAVDAGSPYAWPIALLSPTQIDPTTGIAINEYALTSAVNDAVDEYNKQVVTSEDVSIIFNEESGLYEVVGTAEGKAVDQDVVNAEAKSSIESFRRSCNIDTKKAMRPASVQDMPEYGRIVETANRSRTSDIPIYVNGEVVITSDAAQNAMWVTIGEGPSVVVDEAALRWWADSAVQYVTYHADDWNYYYLDQEAFVSQLYDHLVTGNTEGFEAPMIEERSREGLSRDAAYANSGWNSEMGRYIDVDLAAQFARLFDESGNVIWESAIVTGDLYEGRSTVTGTFEIYAMEQGATLVGLDYNADGYPDYESYVNYWMPFYGGYGLHDATWRGDFGGDLYAYDGSHGCVNLPFAKAEELYFMTHVGETVNVHW